MNWSSVTIFLALLFTTACSQRGGRRYVADQPQEESLAVENHRFQTRSRGDVEDARRGEGRRARIQETTEINSRSLSGRSRVKTEETRQFHSRSGKEPEKRPVENRQSISRRTQETDTKRFTSREETRSERFKSRETLVTTERPSRNQNFVRGRTTAEGRDVEYKTRGTESNRFSGRGTQERGESSRISQDSGRSGVGESRRSETRDRSQVIRKNNVIEPPKSIDPVTERFHHRQTPKEEIQISQKEEAVEKITQSSHHTPTTEGQIQDLTSKSNSIEAEKRTRPLDVTVTEAFHSRQSAREESIKRRIDPSSEKIEYTQTRGRKTAQELPTRGSGTETRRRSRPTEGTVTERFHSRQLAREDLPAKRGRLSTQAEKIRSKNEQITGTRKDHEFVSRRNGIESEKRKPSGIASTERFHSRQSARENLKTNKIEVPTTETNHRVLSPTTEVEKNAEQPNKEESINAVEVESTVQTENAASEQTLEANVDLENSKPVTKQPDPLSTENTVDFPIKSNDVEEPSRTSRKLESDIPERTGFQRGQNRDLENSNRGRLESSLSRDRSRTKESSTRGTEGRRSSRRFTTPSPENENKDRRNLQRFSSRVKYTETSDIRGKQKLDESAPRQRTKESPAVRSRTHERTPEAVLVPEPVTESRIEDKISTETQIQNEQKNEVTVATPTEISAASTQRTLGRIGSRKPGNRGRGQVKVAKALKGSEHSGEVRDDDNYPEVYKQLKKSGTDSKDILVLPP